MYITRPIRNNSNTYLASLCKQTGTLPETRLDANAHLFREGDRVARIYQITSGMVSMTRHSEDGRRQIIAFGFPGDIVGYPCGDRHHTNCKALTPVTLQPYRLSQVTGEQADPDLHSSFLAAALGEIGKMQDRMMMLGSKSATEKVASFLTVLAERSGTVIGRYMQVDLPMSRADIADYLGLTTETISRSFTQLRRDRMITLDGKHTVILLHPEALRGQLVACHD